MKIAKPPTGITKRAIAETTPNKERDNKAAGKAITNDTTKVSKKKKKKQHKEVNMKNKNPFAKEVKPADKKKKDVKLTKKPAKKPMKSY